MTNASFISLTTDGWTSLNYENYVGITAHFMDENCSIKSYLLSCCKFQIIHSAENISKELKNMSEWSVENKIVACTWTMHQTW